MTSHDERQEGQTLVQVALLLVVLLAFLALAVDVGAVYLKRRQLQNAADAAALETARYMCFVSGDFSPSGHATAETFGEAVGLANAPQSTVTFPTPAYPDPQYKVTAVVTETISSFAANIVGLSEYNPGARATAACGAADRACGLWPIAFEINQWQDLYDRGCGVTFYVWAGNNMNQDPDCTIYDCDVDGDGVIDVINSTGRSWLDFSDVVDPTFGDTCAQSGCGTSELGCWLLSNSMAQLTIPACIPGDNGVRAAARSDVEARAGDSVSVPLFDYTGCPGQSCPGGTTYHATSLGCIVVGGWIQQFELPRQDGGNPPWKDKVIYASISCDECNTACGSTGGGVPVPGGVTAVSLIE